MEAQDAERIVIAKPVASRPSYSSLNSFSGLLSGARSPSPSSSFSETAVGAIRPKTVRIKSEALHRGSTAIGSSQGEVSGTAGCFSFEDPEVKSSVVYKPLAKLVSSKTVKLLANMENFDIGNQFVLPHMQSAVQHAYNSDQYLQKFPSQVKPKQTSESSQSLEESRRVQLSTTSGDRPSYDGYNWRKYGQKQVKGSEYPRSYYKCTHPSCPVKKKVERSLDGEIAEIVYKGEHNHSKPHPPKRHSSGLQEQGFILSSVSGQEIGNPSRGARSGGSEGRIESKVTPINLYDSAMFGTFNDCEEGSRGLYAEDAAPKFKRRKNGHQSNEVGILGQEGAQDSEVLGDGFRWRKYGQKVVKGNPYPRSYYRCTSIKCNVRKHVERAVDNPSAFITTYEGKHNHEMLTMGNLNPAASDPDSAALSNKNSYI